jgi:hypothetical protein
MRKHGYRDNADAYNQGRSSSGPGGQSRLAETAGSQRCETDCSHDRAGRWGDIGKSVPAEPGSVVDKPIPYTPTARARDRARASCRASGAATGMVSRGRVSPTLPCEANASRADRSTSRRENQGVTLYQIFVNGRPWGDPQTSMTAAELLGIRELAPRFIDWTVVPVSSGGER